MGPAPTILLKSFFTLLLVVWIIQESLLAQVPDSTGKQLILRVDFEGVKSIDEDFLAGNIQTRQNYWLINKSVKPGLWLYRTFGFIFPETRFSSLNYVGNYFRNNFGEAPIYFSDINLADDRSYLEQYYRYLGFFRIRVDTATVRSPDGVKVTFRINEGPQGKLETIRYDLPQKDEAQIARVVYNNQIVKEGEPWSVFKIRDERARILSSLQEKGYAFTQSDSITVVADTTGFPDISLTLVVRPSSKSVVAGQSMTIYTNSIDSGERLRDTLSVNGIRIRTTSSRELKPDIITRHIDLESGELFSPGRRVNTLRNLNELGVFNSVNVSIDSLAYDRVNDQYEVYTAYTMQMAPKHEIRPQIRLDDKSDGSFGSDLIYTNKNIFNAAENLRISVGGSVQIPASLTGNKTEYSEWSVNGGIDLNFPYFMGTSNRSQISARWQQASKTALQRATNKREPYDLTIITTGLRVQWRHAEYTRSYIDILEVNWVKAGKSYFTTLTDDRRLREPYVNSVFRWTTQWLNTNIIERNYGGSQEISLEESGLIPRLLSTTVDKSDVQTSEDGQTGRIFGVNYYQYLKLQTDLRWYIPVTTTDNYAFKLVLGYITPYGISKDTPEINRFFGGGITSLRGWLPTELGPGSLPRSAADSTSRGYFDIKLEGSVEYRKKWNSDWGYALFVDYGNLWNREGKPGSFTFKNLYREIAVNYGVGIRYFLPIGPARLDFAWKAWNPSAPAGQRWLPSTYRLNDPGGFFDQMSFYIGIGHSF